MKLDNGLISPFQFFRRSSPEDHSHLTTQHEQKVGEGRLHIRCPKCGWEPRQRDYWACLCGHEWNTFDTGGKCPHCNRLWENTQCLRCHQWSRHDDWYEWGNDSNRQES